MADAQEDPLAHLRRIITRSDRPDPAAVAELHRVLKANPSPRPPPHGEKTLADMLDEPAPANITQPAAFEDLVSLLKSQHRGGSAVPAPPVNIFPKESLFAGIARGTSPFGYSGHSPFSGLDRMGARKDAAKKRKEWEKNPEKKEKVQKLSLLLLKEMGEEQPPVAGAGGGRDGRYGVQETFELERILAIPRRPSDLSQYADLTERFRRPEGTMQLWPTQSAVLTEAPLQNGCFAMLGVGWGKTLSSLLVGAAMGAKMIVLMVPPQLRTQLLEKDIPELNKHWKLPLDKLRVVAYSELSNARSHDILEQIKPDLIVADEGHNLRHKNAARTKRFLRYMKDHPECRLVVLSGTLTRRSLKDYQHLAELSLLKNSPLPRSFRDLEDWAGALDVQKSDPMPPGALLKLCNDEELRLATSTHDPREIQKHVRHAFRRRLVETPGVVATEESALGTSLVITGLRPLIPAEVQLALTDLRESWKIEEEELIDILSVVRVAAQLAAGFHYRWVWPNGVKDVEWLEARKAWNKELRDILKLSKRGLDSPLLVMNAIERGEFESGSWAAWAKVKDRYHPTPPREGVWHSKFLVQESIRWAHETCSKGTPGIIWYRHDEFGREVAREGNFPFFGPGMKASAELARVKAKEAPVIVCSQKAHGTGKNLQSYCRNLFTTCPGSGADWEQTMARTHRPGQEADEVNVDVFLHTDEMQDAFYSALRDARYIEQTQGQKQKILYAEKLNCGV